MAVTAESFKLSGGACATEAAAIVAALGQHGITGTNSSGVISITLSDLTGSNGLHQFDNLCRIAKAAQAKLTYVKAILA